MTVIAIKDGVLAVDSRVSFGDVTDGEAKKWVKVPDEHGGGYAACSGDLGPAQAALDALVKDYNPTGKQMDLLHLRADGSVWCYSAGESDSAMVEMFSDNFAAGSGARLAIGAMEAGASAEEAVRIACKRMPTSCGGTIHVFKVSQ